MCKQPEPIPGRCFAPKEFELWLRAMGIEWLGDTVLSPGACFEYRVLSGPCCRIFLGNGKPEPHSYESGWRLNDSGKWEKISSNYLSYLVSDGSYVTVRWQSPQKAKEQAMEVAA